MKRFEIQLVLAYFNWIGDDGTEKMEGNSEESYNNLDEN